MRKPCRQQFALLIALFDESESMYLSSGRAMRHVLLDADFDSKNTCSLLLRECVLVSLAKYSSTFSFAVFHKV